MRKVYLDNAATTMVRKEVLDAMIPAFTTYYGNPSSLHEFAREAGELVDAARAKVAAAINAKPDEIVFTGGGRYDVFALLLVGGDRKSVV